MKNSIEEYVVFDEEQQCEDQKMQEVFLGVMKKPQKTCGDRIALFYRKYLRAREYFRQREAIMIRQIFFYVENFGKILLDAQQNNRECRSDAGKQKNGGMNKRERQQAKSKRKQEERRD